MSSFISSSSSFSSSSVSNPWSTSLSSSSALDNYCDNVLDHVENISIKNIPYDSIGSNDPDDIVYKLMKADIIVKKQRKKRYDEKLQSIEADAKSLFSEESSNEVIDACKQLVGYIKQHHTSDNIQSLIERIRSMDCIALDGDARKAFDQCVLNLEDLHNCRYDRSMIKESVEKLVMKAKFEAMKMTNECKALEKKMKILMQNRSSPSQQEGLSRSSVSVVDDKEGVDIQGVVRDLSISERQFKSMETTDLVTLD